MFIVYLQLVDKEPTPSRLNGEWRLYAGWPTGQLVWHTRRCPAHSHAADTANPLWELSSPSEAAKAAALLVEVLSELPLSRASPLPHLIGVAGLSVFGWRSPRHCQSPVGAVEL